MGYSKRDRCAGVDKGIGAERRGLLSWLVIVFIAMVLPLALSGCGQSSSPSADDSKKPIKVGAYLALTGPIATFGQTTRDGLQLAVQQRNAQGGVNGRLIELIVYDNQGKTQEVGTAVTRLITNDQVVAVLGEVASTLSLAAAPIAQQYGVPMISPSSTNPQVTQVGDMIFRVCFIDPDQGYAAAKFAFEKLKFTRAAILLDQKQAYSTGLAEAFRKAFTQMGGSITSEQSYSSGDRDFSAQLTSIRDSQPEIIFTPGYYNDVPSIAIQARRLGMTQPFLGGDGWETPDLGKFAQGALDGSYYTNHYAPEDQRPESVAYVEAYKKAYGVAPGALSALGYDAANVLFAAMERAPSLSGKDLAKAIGETRDFAGVTGRISLNADRNAVKPMVILQIKANEPVFVMMIEPPGK